MGLSDNTILAYTFPTFKFHYISSRTFYISCRFHSREIFNIEFSYDIHFLIIRLLSYAQIGVNSLFSVNYILRHSIAPSTYMPIKCVR